MSVSRATSYGLILFSMVLPQLACDSKESKSNSPSRPTSPTAQSSGLPDSLTELVKLFEEKAAEQIYLSPAWDISNAVWTREMLNSSETFDGSTDRYSASFPHGTFTARDRLERIVQGRGLKCEIYQNRFSNADTLNGIEWVGWISISAAARRGYGQAGVAEPLAWSKWRDDSGWAVRYRAVRKSGTWTLSVPTALDRGDAGWAMKPEEIPGDDEKRMPVTREFAAGKLMGEQMLRLLPNGGKVVIFTDFLDSPHNVHMLDGINQAIHGHGIEIVGRYQERADTARHRKDAERVMANPDLTLFCALTPSSAITLAQVSARAPGKRSIVSYGSTTDVLEAVRTGTITCTVAGSSVGSASLRVIDATSITGQQ